MQKQWLQQWPAAGRVWKNPRLRAVFMDYDGTIGDTFALACAAMRTAVAPYGLCLDEARYAPLFGIALREQALLLCPKEDPDAICAAFRAYYRSRANARSTPPYPGLAETLKQLQARGVQLAMVTAKTNASLLPGLESYGVAEYMSFNISRDVVQQPKPNPEPVLKALERAGCAPQEALMLGDSPYDLQAAMGAGVPAVLVSWTHFGPEAFAGLPKPPDAVLWALPDLLNI